MLIANDIVEILFQNVCANNAVLLQGLVIASFLGLHHFPLHEERGQPGIFPHMCDVKSKKVEERT